MDLQANIRAKKSKLAAYYSGMQKAKDKGDAAAVRKWTDGMVAIRKELSALMTQQ